jgi:hypothetical protein
VGEYICFLFIPSHNPLIIIATAEMLEWANKGCNNGLLVGCTPTEYPHLVMPKVQSMETIVTALLGPFQHLGSGNDDEGVVS